MIEARTHPFHGGWMIHEASGGPNEGWTRSATRDGRELHQGAMDYHAFLTALERIAGIPCFGDYIEGLQHGLDKDGAWAQAKYTEAEAWGRALAQSEGRPWDRQAHAQESPQVIFQESVPVEVNITVTHDPTPALCPVEALPWDPEPTPAPAPAPPPVAAPEEGFIQAALARMKARNNVPAQAAASAPAAAPLPRALSVAQALQPSLFGEEF